MLGHFAAQQRRGGVVLAAARALMARAPLEPETQFREAVANYCLGRYSRALSAILRCIELREKVNPGQISGWHQLRMIGTRHALGQHRPGLEALDRLLARDKRYLKFSHVWHLKRRLHLALGQQAEADLSTRRLQAGVVPVPEGYGCGDSAANGTSKPARTCASAGVKLSPASIATTSTAAWVLGNLDTRSSWTGIHPAPAAG